MIIKDADKQVKKKKRKTPIVLFIYFYGRFMAPI
jgi:hypothetical protein